MRIAVGFVFLCFGFAVTANAAAQNQRDRADKRHVVFLDPDQPFEIAANVPENKDPDKSLMGEDRIPSEEEEEAPPVFEEPGAEPEAFEGDNELPPSAEDEYLPESRPKAKAKSKTYKKRKKTVGHKRKKKRAKHRANRKSKARHRARSRSRGQTKRAVERFTWPIFRRSARGATKHRRGYAAVGGPKTRYSGHHRKRKSSKTYDRDSSYRSRRLHEYRAYTSHIMPFGY